MSTTSSPAGPTVAVAESCTAGRLSMLIEEIPDSGEWFKGGVVSYDSDVKFSLLKVPMGPVITPDAAVQMARGVRELLGADIGVATTGVAGPESQENQPVGTVYVGIVDARGEQSLLLRLPGSPTEVKDQASRHALQRVMHSRSASQVPSDVSGA